MKNNALIMVATVLSFGLLYLLAFKEVPDKNIQLFIFLAGMVCGYFFGASLKQPSTLPTNALPSPEEEVKNLPAG